MDIPEQCIKEQRLHLEILRRVMCVQLCLEKRFHDDLKLNMCFLLLFGFKLEMEIYLDAKGGHYI